MSQNLKDILYGVNIVATKGSTDVMVDHLTFDSRETKEGSVFFAIKGVRNDGHNFISQVVENGCKVLIVEQDIKAPEDVHVVQVVNTKKALAVMASNYYCEPFERIEVNWCYRDKWKNNHINPSV